MAEPPSGVGGQFRTGLMAQLMSLLARHLGLCKGWPGMSPSTRAFEQSICPCEYVL